MKTLSIELARVFVVVTDTITMRDIVEVKNHLWTVFIPILSFHKLFRPPCAKDQFPILILIWIFATLSELDIFLQFVNLLLCSLKLKTGEIFETWFRKKIIYFKDRFRADMHSAQ